ncbi:MAG: hypothetical protein ACRENU_07235 [Gemmatimonadaceae bacterium]
MTQRRKLLSLVVWVAFQSCRQASASPATPNPAEQAQQAPPVRAETLATRPIVEMHCSDTRRGTEIATVRVRPRSLTPDSAWLDVTVFKDGFASRRFASVTLMPGARRTSLRVHDLGRQHAPAAFRFDTTHVSIARDSLVIRVENLEPGLNYFVRFGERVRGTILFTQTVRALAPTCHGD